VDGNQSNKRGDGRRIQRGIGGRCTAETRYENLKFMSISAWPAYRRHLQAKQAETGISKACGGESQAGEIGVLKAAASSISINKRKQKIMSS